MRRILSLLFSLLDPRVYLHGLKLLHYYNYTHVSQRGRLRMGPDVRLAPNVSVTNGERVAIGARSNIGARCSLWAGEQARIVIGEDALLAPDVFVTAADYDFGRGRPVARQPKRETDVCIGDDVWLGARVVVLAGVRIGDGCVVGAGSVVTTSLPAGSVAVGVPARPVGKRPGYGGTRRERIKEVAWP